MICVHKTMSFELIQVNKDKEEINSILIKPIKLIN